MKKVFTVFLIVTILCTCVILLMHFSNAKEPDMSIEETVKQYETIISMVRNGTIKVKPNGCIVLPEEFKRLSDNGECFIVKFHGDTAIYFYSYRGILESSKGYLYITDKLCYTDYVDTVAYVATQNFVNLVEIQKNLFSCSTD